jgi:hypothetical protein
VASLAKPETETSGGEVMAADVRPIRRRRVPENSEGERRCAFCESDSEPCLLCRTEKDVRSKPASASTTAPPHPWRRPWQRLDSLRCSATRLTTGIASLDSATRGGFPLGKVGVVGGAPGALKTMLLVNIARCWSLAGHHVLFLAADGGVADILTRFAQLEGFDREQVELADAETLVALEQRMRERHTTLDVIDGSEATIESAATKLAQVAAGEPAALFVDSLQKAHSEFVKVGDGLRAVVDANMRAILAVGRRLPIAVLASSEMARGWYRSKKLSEQTNALASFKESGSVEYGADLEIALLSAKGRDDLVSAEIVKNRLGRKTTFWLQLEHTTAAVTECDPTAECFETLDSYVDKERAAKVEQAVLDVLAVATTAGETPLSSRQLRKRCSTGNNTEISAAVDRLAERELVIVERKGEGKNAPKYVSLPVGKPGVGGRK